MNITKLGFLKYKERQGKVFCDPHSGLQDAFEMIPIHLFWIKNHDCWLLDGPYPTVIQ